MLINYYRLHPPHKLTNQIHFKLPSKIFSREILLTINPQRQFLNPINKILHDHNLLLPIHKTSLRNIVNNLTISNSQIIQIPLLLSHQTIQTPPTLHNPPLLLLHNTSMVLLIRILIRKLIRVFKILLIIKISPSIPSVNKLVVLPIRLVPPQIPVLSLVFLLHLQSNFIF